MTGEFLRRVLLQGSPEKYKGKPVLAVGHVGRYKDSLYFSLVPGW